ncbi:MAG TPA: ATP-binding protein [Coriobacteriia bacterium]
MFERSRARFLSSYRLRLTLGYVVVVAILAAAWLASLFGPLTAAVKDQQRSHLATIARSYALALEYSAGSPQEFVERIAARDLHVSVIAAGGRVMGDNRTAPGSIADQKSRPEVAAALSGRVGYDVRRGETGDAQQMYVAVPARYGGGPSAMRVSESLASVGALAAEARSVGLLGLALAIAVALFVTARLSSSAVAPIDRLTSAANAIAGGDLQYAVRRESGDLEVLSDALADLAEQVRARTQASESEQANLRTVLDGLDDAVILLDGEVVSLANGAMSQLFRMPFGGWRNRRLADTGLPPSLLSAIGRPPEGAGRSVQEIGPDPTGRTLRVTVVPVGVVDWQRRSLVVISDISERARLDAMRRDFVANASHELKTPASAIQLLAEAASTAAADGDAEQSLAFVAQMRAEADRLRKLVLDLLDLSRLEQVGSEEAITDVRTAVDLAITGHRASAEAKCLVIERDLAAIENEDVYLAMEPTDAAIALDNLLSNAIAYTERGGVVVRVSLRDGAVALEVSDTGIGIPPDALPRVFERFFRVDKGRSRDSGGTGLGLSLVRHVVERNGGGVSISSEAGVGTTVTLLLPRAV